MKKRPYNHTHPFAGGDRSQKCTFGQPRTPLCCPEITPISNHPRERAPSTPTGATLHHVTSGRTLGPSFAGKTPGPPCGSAGLQAVGECQGDSAGDRKHLEEALCGAGQAGGIHHPPAGRALVCSPLLPSQSQRSVRHQLHLKVRLINLN